MRKRKPTFARQNAHRKKRVKNKGWRRPRGIDSKQKRHEQQMGALPTIGYGKPKKERGLHPCGLQEIRIFNVKELAGLDPKTHAIRIGASVGKKRKIEIMKEAESKKFKILGKKQLEIIAKELKKKAEKRKAKKVTKTEKSEKEKEEKKVEKVKEEKPVEKTEEKPVEKPVEKPKEAPKEENKES